MNPAKPSAIGPHPTQSLVGPERPSREMERSTALGLVRRTSSHVRWNFSTSGPLYASTTMSLTAMIWWARSIPSEVPRLRDTDFFE